MQPQSHFVSLGGRRFHYLDWNSSADAAVILLHGFNQTAHSWQEFAEAAERSLRVVALDQRGHGDTDAATDGDYGRESMAGDVALLADRLGLQRFSVVGMSMGAVHAILLATRHPQRVSAVVIVDYAPVIEQHGAALIAQIAAMSWSSFGEAVDALHLFNPRRSKDNIRHRLGHSLRETEDGTWVWKVDTAGLAAHPRFREPAESMWEALSDIECPALLIRGGNSELLRADVAEQAVAQMPRGALTTVDGAGHSVAGDNPAGFRDAVLPFLIDHSAG